MRKQRRPCQQTCLVPDVPCSPRTPPGRVYKELLCGAGLGAEAVVKIKHGVRWEVALFAPVADDLVGVRAAGVATIVLVVQRGVALLLIVVVVVVPHVVLVRANLSLNSGRALVDVVLALRHDLLWAG